MMHKRALLAYQVVAALLFAAILPLPFAAAQEVSTPAAPGPEVTAAVVTLTATADTTIREGSPGTNYGTLSLLTVERDDFLQQAVVLQNFDLSGILPGSTIHSAELQLNLQEATGGFPTIPVDVSRITGFWTETAVTWNSRPGWTCCDATVSVGTAVGTDYTWDVTTLVDDWVNDGATHPNRGVALSGPAGFHQRAFASRESVSEPPRLVIDYTPPPPDAAIVASVYQAIPSVKRDDNILGIDAWVQQDFYLKMSVNGEPDLTSPVVDQRDYAEWNPPFTGTADVIAAQRFYPVRIELWDEDDVDPDDQFNINPIAPSPDVSKTLNVLFDACTLRWSAGSLSFGPGPSWVPYPMPENVGQLAQIQMAIAPVDARSFAPDDIAITHAEPVQAVYGARQIIAEKATAFRLDLSSSQPGPAQVSVEVTLSDGLSSATHIRNAIVPTDGLRLFFFDGSDGVGPFFPKKADDARLTYDVVVTVLSGEGDDPAW
ncbi:MAG: DNRLRE domain-containing protein, partial [Anaerolineae bacterium]|nr:DNRLRE domain-containing protein [Anaerolineae bacterium]